MGFPKTTKLQLPLAQNFMAIGLAGLIGAVAVLLIDHRLSASADHAQAIARPAAEQAAARARA